MGKATRRAIDVYFDVEGQELLSNGRSQIRPTDVRIQWHAGNDEPTIWVKGPILRTSGEGLSNRKATVLFGRFGGGFGHAPKWVRNLVERVELMQVFDDKTGA